MTWRRRGPPPPVTMLDGWRAAVLVLRTLGPAAARLATGSPMMDDDALIVFVAPQHDADARRALCDPDVAGAIRHAFRGRITTIEIRPWDNNSARDC